MTKKNYCCFFFILNTNGRSGTSRSYKFTWFCGDKFAEYYAILYCTPCKYMLCQLEESPDTGLWHFQGVVTFDNAKRFTAVRKLFPGAHIQNIGADEVRHQLEYCSKTHTRVAGIERIDRGTRPTGPGVRSDLIGVAQMLSAGKSILKIFADFPATTIRNLSNIERMQRLMQPRRTHVKKVFILWGETGTGKTRSVLDFFNYPKDDIIYMLPPNSGTNNMFFTGYDDTIHDCVLIDDFYGKYPWSSLLRICDRYPIKVQVRDSSPIHFNPKYLIFTSNKDPRLWYKNMHWPTLLRRLHAIIHFTVLTGSKINFNDYPKHGQSGSSDVERIPQHPPAIGSAWDALLQ